MIQVNLLPGGKRKSGRGGGKFSLSSFSLPSFKGGKLPADPWILGAVATGIAIVAGIAWMRVSVGGQQEEMAVALEEALDDSTRFADLITRTSALTARRDSIAQKVGIIQQIDQGRYIWPHVLDEVARALPDYTWLTALTQVAGGDQGVQIRIEGQAGNIYALTSFMEGLEASPFFQGVRLLGSEQTLMPQERQVVVTFQMEAAYVHPPLELLETVPLFETETVAPGAAGAPADSAAAPAARPDSTGA